MDLKQLRTFVAVSEHGSVTEAAVRLRTAQPALSRQIIELELELGLKLFDRIGRRLVLSKDGEHLLQECRAVLQQTALFREAAEGLRAGDAGSLRIAASPQILESVLARFLLQYERSYPKVKMRFVEAVGRDQLTLLERGDCDIGIGIGQVEAVSAETRFATFDLVDLEIVAAFGAGFQLGNAGPSNSHSWYIILCFFWIGAMPFAGCLTEFARQKASGQMFVWKPRTAYSAGFCRGRTWRRDHSNCGRDSALRP